MTLPNFLVIGAAKAGTTSLRGYLNQHPEIFMADRLEPSFFAHEGETLTCCGPGDDEWQFITDLEAYEELFATAGTAAAIGEISPRYLYFERACERIGHYAPDMRLIAVLRHPVDRAYSHFLMNQARDCEPEADFVAAIAAEDERAAQGWGWDWRYVGAGRYHAQLARYYERFPADRIKVLLYDDLRHRPDVFFGELFDFLGVEKSFRPDTQVRQREAGLPRSHQLRRLLEDNGRVRAMIRRLVPGEWKTNLRARLATWNTARPERLPDDQRRRLFETHFADDCRRLAALIDRDLGVWATAPERLAS